jgi:LCP family protein required for cell wall assembly
VAASTPCRGWRLLWLSALALACLLLMAAGLVLLKVRGTVASVTQTPMSLHDTLGLALNLPGYRHRAAPRDYNFAFYQLDDAFWEALLGEEGVLELAPGDEVKALAPLDLASADPYRTNVLILGMRGADDPQGGLLSDAIMLLSLHEKLGRIAFISIPRDLYVPIPGSGRYHKLNAAHAIGERQGGRGLELALKTVEQVVGVPIHYAVSVDFRAFTEAIDTLGGIEVEVQRDFAGTRREGLELSAGRVFMDGETALVYATSRQTTNDFDRSRRQREIAQATLQRARQLALYRDPLRLLSLMDTLGKHVRTTMTPYELREMVTLAESFDLRHTIEKGFDASPAGLLKATRSTSGAYILLPRDGDFSALQAAVRTVFE